MKLHIKIFCFFAAFIVVTAVAISTAKAQKNEPPSGQFGFGVYASEDFSCGVDGVYALSPNLQIGSLLSFNVRSGGGNSSSLFLLGPFVRILASSKVSPYFEGRFMLFTGSGNSNAGLFLGGGLAYYLNHEIGVHAGIDIINLYFSPSFTIFGLTSFLAGADWFF